MGVTASLNNDKQDFDAGKDTIVAVEVMAKAVEELLKMMQNGEIMVADVLPKFAIELEKAVGADQVKRVETLTASKNRLKNACTDFIEEINGSDNVIGNFAIGFLSVLTDMLNGINRVASSWKSIRDEGRKSNESFGNESAMNNYLDFDKFENQRKRAFKDRQKFLKEEQELIDQIKDGEQCKQLLFWLRQSRNIKWGVRMVRKRLRL